MTKQEEIRGGIDMKLPIAQTLNEALWEFLQDYGKYITPELGKPYKTEPFDYYIAKAINDIVCRLHSQGVVIKVGRELPQSNISGGTMDCEDRSDLKRGADWMKDTMLRAGYVAVEPLIKEE